AAKALVKELQAQQAEINKTLKAAAKAAAEEYLKVIEQAGQGQGGQKKKSTGKSSASTASVTPLVPGSATAAAGLTGPWTVEVTLTTDKRYAAAVVRSGIQEVARTDKAVLRAAVM